MYNITNFKFLYSLSIGLQIEYLADLNYINDETNVVALSGKLYEYRVEPPIKEARISAAVCQRYNRKTQ